MDSTLALNQCILNRLNCNDFRKEWPEINKYIHKYIHISTGAEVILFSNEECQIDSIEIDCGYFPNKLWFDPPKNIDPNIFVKVFDHIENINSKFEDFVKSTTSVKDYFKVGDDIIGLAEGNNNFLFSFKDGILDKCF